MVWHSPSLLILLAAGYYHLLDDYFGARRHHKTWALFDRLSCIFSTNVIVNDNSFVFFYGESKHIDTEHRDPALCNSLPMGDSEEILEV